MKIELIKIQDSEAVCPIYYITVDGGLILNGWTGDYEEALDLYNKIVADPDYLNSRSVVLQSTNI